MDGEEAKRTKGERRRARCSVEQGTRASLGGEEKRKEPKIISDGKHRILKIGTESRGNHGLCSGLELHHPKMSKLWNLGVQTKRRKQEPAHWVNHSKLTSLNIDEYFKRTT